MFGAYQTLAGGRSFVNKTVLVTFMIEHIGETSFQVPGFSMSVETAAPWRCRLLGRSDGGSTSILRPTKQAESGISLDQLIEAFGAHWEAHIMEIERQREAGVLDGSQPPRAALRGLLPITGR